MYCNRRHATLVPPRSGQSDSTPVALEPADYPGVDVGDELPINIVGCYPIHDEERLYIGTHGLKAFREQEWDPFDVLREPAVGPSLDI